MPAVARAVLISVLLLAAVPAPAAERVVGHFSAGDLRGWEAKVFNRTTAYRIEQHDGRRVLAAECRNSASALYRRMKIFLGETPVLRWSWRVDKAYAGLDETQKTGDDYPARVYVVIDGGILRWRTRALNYVWASGQPAGRSWLSAYTKQAMMVALRSSPDAGWRDEARDLRRDFRALFGIEPEHIDGVALMTDCDDAHGQGRAWYGDIRFTAK
jgi:hypothetical protein